MTHQTNGFIMHVEIVIFPNLTFGRGFRGKRLQSFNNMYVVPKFGCFDFQLSLQKFENNHFGNFVKRSIRIVLSFWASQQTFQDPH